MTRQMHRWQRYKMAGMRDRGHSTLNTGGLVGDELRRARSMRRMLFSSLLITAFITAAICYMAADPNGTLRQHLQKLDYKRLP